MQSTTVIGICYGSLALFISILHNVFLIYHVETFVSIYKIDKASFWIGEAIFLLWNSFNDPLFGWISDKSLISQQGRPQGTLQVLHKRLTLLSWNGPLFAASFCLFWISWTYPALQFIVCLCLYDGFLTMIDLQHSALLADLVVTNEARTKLNSYCSFFSALGSASVFLSYFVWTKDNLQSFQLMCAIMTIFSVVGFFICTRLMKNNLTMLMRNEDSSQKSSQLTEETEEGNQKSALKSYISQLAGHKNFMWFSCMNLIQVFHCHFNSNFFPIFLENLLVGMLSPTFGAILLGISFTAPHINNLYFLSLCRKHGVYNVIYGLFAVKLLLSFAMLGLGPTHTWLLCIFIASNRVFTEGTCKLLNLVISDLVDEDYVLHHRKQPVSALIFGTANFMSKPGQTFAPLIGTWLLAMYTGHDIFDSGNTMGSIKLSINSMSPAQQLSHKQGVFNLLVYVPIICAILQLLFWSRFTLHGKRLQWIKSLRSGAKLSMV